LPFEPLFPPLAADLDESLTRCSGGLTQPLR
jgi:hypothetical protein